MSYYKNFCVFMLFLYLASSQAIICNSWWDTTHKNRYTIGAGVVGSTALGTLLYKWLWGKSNKEENLVAKKHFIINDIITLLEKKESEKIQDWKATFNNCINGTEPWKVALTEEMLDNSTLPNDILTRFKDRTSKNDDNKKYEPSLDFICKTIGDLKNVLMANIVLLHKVKQYAKDTMNTWKDHLWTYQDANNTQNILAKREGDYFYVYIKDNTRFGNPAIEDSVINNVDECSIYKIHLMPKIQDLEQVIKTIHGSKELEQMVGGVKFRSVIRVGLTAGAECRAFDVNNPTCICDHKGFFDVGPLIVLYTTKEKTQELLNTVYAIFKEQPGLNLTPQFNRKITSLIYYAQGNSIHKIQSPENYEQPNLVLCKSDISPNEYYLKNPTKNISASKSSQKSKRPSSPQKKATFFGLYAQHVKNNYSQNHSQEVWDDLIKEDDTENNTVQKRNNSQKKPHYTREEKIKQKAIIRNFVDTKKYRPVREQNRLKKKSSSELEKLDTGEGIGGAYMELRRRQIQNTEK